ncbi:GNAT family N-acetyltransferase [Variovorax sp. V15]|uniref:GNAT family N-acetyltransferase n=1 Tax=Variovorax sp. V15 TaxID=3065952 RepID=UPI0034E88711
MQFNESPTIEQLRELQKLLSENLEKNGIQNIYGEDDPFYLLAEDAGVSLGIATINLGSEEAELYKLYVPPTHARKGVGTALVKKAIEILQKNQIKELHIEIAGESHDFWNRIVENREIRIYAPNKFGILLDEH